MTDIIGGRPDGWIVVGWFTPDYRPLAEAHAKRLSAHGAAHHLFAKVKGTSEGWSTRRKPSIVREAMALYPDCTIVLMDVDCIVSGDISPIVNGAHDVGISVIGRDKPRKKVISVSCSSRVVVFRPTIGALAFVDEWQRRVDASDRMNDEHALAWAYLACGGVSFAYLDQRFAGWEVSAEIDGAVVTHDSAHERSRDIRSLRDAVKALERRFLRSGRSAKIKRDSDLSIDHSPQPYWRNREVEGSA